MIKETLKSMALAFAFMAAASAVAGDLAWPDSFEGVKKEAKEKNLPILALFTGSDWCSWCMKLEQEVFSQKEFQDYASKSLILFKADFPKYAKLQPGVIAQNQALQEKYEVGGYPTVILMDAEGKVLAQTGYEKGGAAKYVERLKAMLKKAGK